MDDVTKQKISDIASDFEDMSAGLESVLSQFTSTTQALKALVGDDVPPASQDVVVQLGSVTATQLTVSWAPVPGADAYMVGRDGQDRGGYGAWSMSMPADGPRTIIFENLKAQTDYGITVTAYQGLVELGETLITARTAADPVVPPPVTPPATGKGLALVGRSGTGTNVVLFRSGVDDLAGLTKRETDLGVKFDGLMRFVPRANESEFLAESFWNQMGQVAATGRVVVIAMPWAPESAGVGMNAAVARGDWDKFQLKVAGLVLKYGLNRPNVVIRLSWEYNSTGNGGWYHWSTANGGVATFKTAWSRTRTNFKIAGVGQVLWDQCANKGPQANNQVSGADVYVDADLVGIDHYAMWPAQKDAASFAQAVNQVPGIASQRALAATKGVQWSVDEAGPANPAGKDLGGDSAAYAQGMVSVLKSTTTTPPALFVLYDDGGAPSTFDHTLANNPNWAKAIIGWLKGL